MQKWWYKIPVWLGIMAILTLLVMGIWMVAFSASRSTVSLKWLQFMQTIGTFLLPAFLCAWLWDEGHRPFQWLKLNCGANLQVFALAVAIMVCALPGINLLADLNSRIVLPECLAGLEQLLKQQEETAAALTERFLQADNGLDLFLNIGLMALLPALAEEISFRGTLQQIITGSQAPGTKNHIAIWISAFVFSAIHMQFYGFIPRMLMGALFGYMFVWTGCLWVPVVMHFTNNGIAVIVYYLTSDSEALQTQASNIADTLGAGDTWWLGILSLIAVGALLRYLVTSQDLPGYVRRTHTR